MTCYKCKKFIGHHQSWSEVWIPKFDGKMDIENIHLKEEDCEDNNLKKILPD